MSGLAYIVVVLAAYRLTRIVTTDTLTEAFRARLYDWAWDDEAGEIVTVRGEQQLVPKARAAWRTYAYELFTCPLCLGVWVSAGVYSAWRWWDVTAVHAVIAVFAVAGAQCFLATRDGA